MPFRTLKLLPGVDLESSPTLNQVRLAASKLVRFYTGLVQKLGGWAAMSPTPLIGACRGLEGWSDLIGNVYIAAGTEQRLEVLTGGALYDITPVIRTDNPAVAFSTTNGSADVTLADTAYGPNIGDWINLLTQVSVGGIVLQGYYPVSAVVDGTHYTVDVAAPATATVTNGGAVPVFSTSVGSASVNVLLASHGLSAGQTFTIFVSTTVGGLTLTGDYIVSSVVDSSNFVISAAATATSTATASENGGNARIEYLLPTGYAVNTPISGYGIGDYGSGDYGLAGSGSITGALRQWSMDHWGQSLIASPSGGAIYFWTPPTVQPASVVSGTAPIYNTAVFVNPQARIIVALGAETGGVQQPLLVRWCDQDDFTDWTPSTTNQAGSYLLSSGTRLMGGTPVGINALIWTDTDVWIMNYLGFPLVFGFTQLAGSCGLISTRAAGDTAGIVMWLSTRGFYTYQTGGGVDSVECPVWDFIFENIDSSQLDQVHCAVNALFNEMTWFFPIAATSAFYDPTMPLGYVKFNFVEHAWDSGLSVQYQRTAWLEKNPSGNPAGTDLAGLIQQHEVSNDANGEGMAWSWQTGYFSLAEGEEYVFVDLILPDFVLAWTGTTPPVINVTVLGADYPIGLINGAPVIDGPYTISTAQPGATLMVPCRLRARQIALQFSGSDLGSFNRIGAIRVRFASDGRGP